MWHVCRVVVAAQISLRGPKGEPVDFVRTIVSHGVAELPPNRVDLAGRALETTLPVRGGARTVRITARGKKLRIEWSADPTAAVEPDHQGGLLFRRGPSRLGALGGRASGDAG
jgi:hypothetical protein